MVIIGNAGTSLVVWNGGYEVRTQHDWRERKRWAQYWRGETDEVWGEPPHPRSRMSVAQCVAHDEQYLQRLQQWSRLHDFGTPPPNAFLEIL